MTYKIAFAVLTAAIVSGQTPPARPEFEVASIKPSPPLAANLKVGVHIDGAQVRCSFLSLKDYIRSAYKLKDYQISGPEWIASERFEIIATLPSGGSPEQVPAMLLALLEDRFKMKTHRETKTFPVYALVVDKNGLKMKESPPDPDADNTEAPKGTVNVTASGGPAGTTVNFGRGSYFTLGNNKFEAKKLTMAGLAETLARFVERPVVDMTDLKGSYDFVLEFTPEDFRTMMIRSAIVAGVVLPPQVRQLAESGSDDSLMSALQSLGLKLEQRKAPLEVVVVDHIEKTPTAN